MSTRRLEAVVFDWAGTTVDHGCMAPVSAFREVFRRRGVELTLDEARGPMGTHKRRHIELVAQLPSVAARFSAVHGRAPEARDVDAMFEDFVPLQLSCLPRHAEPVPGCLSTVEALRARGLKIGSTTGFTAEMMAVLAPAARKRGFSPDVIVSASDVPRGRPAPDMCLKNALELGVSSVDACVKVDDTVAGIEEGRNAGMWTVGVVMTGNEVGLTVDELSALDAASVDALRARGRARLLAAGAHFVVDGVGDLLEVIDVIEARTPRGLGRAA